MMALAARQSAKVIGAEGVIADRPGFEVDFLTHGSIAETPYVLETHEVLMVMRGHWQLGFEGGGSTLDPGDVCAPYRPASHVLWHPA